MASAIAQPHRQPVAERGPAREARDLDGERLEVHLAAEQQRVVGDGDRPGDDAGAVGRRDGADDFGRLQQRAAGQAGGREVERQRPLQW